MYYDRWQSGFFPSYIGCRYTGIVHFKTCVRGVLVGRLSWVSVSWVSAIRVPGHQTTESRKLTVHAILDPRRKLVYI